MTVGEALIRLLEKYEVEHVFGMPGVHTIELYRGLAASGIRHHTPRHEQGAGFMADGYARVSGKPGVCFVITGPGLTNVATAMAQALADSIPMLVISSVNDELSNVPPRGMLHEMPDQLAFSSQVSRYCITVHNEDDLESSLSAAFAIFSSQRPGPVHLQLPVSLLGKEVSRHLVVSDISLRDSPDSQAIAKMAEVLKHSASPLIIVGGGAIAVTDIPLLAERLDAPVLMTINAKGVVPHGHPLAVGACGTLGSVRELIEDADVVLAVGTELSATEFDQYRDGKFTLPGRLLRCDIDPQQINNNFAADMGVVLDASEFVEHLLTQDIDRPHGNAKARAAQVMKAAHSELPANYKKFVEIVDSIRDRLPNCVFAGDSTQLVYASNLLFNTFQSRSWFNSSTGFGTLGYALPAGIGAAIATQRPVVCLIGDGGLQFTLGELGTLKDLSAMVVVLVWRNGGYREIKHHMHGAGVESVGVEFTVPDFGQIASAYGIDAHCVETLDELCNLISSYVERGEPVLLDVDEDTMLNSL